MASDARQQFGSVQQGPARLPLREQLSRAGRVQRSLLPDVRPPVGDFRLASLYWPCDDLCGDFYDLARRPDGAVLLAADVMGHGVEAALITMLVKAAFQEAAATTSDPPELLAEMRRHLRRFLPPGQAYVAALVVRIEARRAALRLANAGQPHPFVLRGTAGQLDEVAVNGVPLGLADELGLGASPAHNVTLAPGDVLLIASDGLGAVENATGEHLDDGRLREALARLVGRAGDDVITGLAAEALAFGHGRLPDDVNVIAISRKEAGLDGDVAPEQPASGG